MAINYWTALAYFMHMLAYLGQRVHGEKATHCYSRSTTIRCAGGERIYVESLAANETNPQCDKQWSIVTECQNEAKLRVRTKCHNHIECTLPADLQLRSCSLYRLYMEITYSCQNGFPPATSTATARFTSTENPISITNTNDIRTTASAEEKTASTSIGLSVGLPLILILLAGATVTIILVLRFRKKRQTLDMKPDGSGLNNPKYLDVGNDNFLALRGKSAGSDGLHIDDEEVNVPPVKEPSFMEVFYPEMTQSDPNNQVQNHLRHADPLDPYPG